MQNITVKVISALEKVMPDSEPKREEGGACILQNERYHFQLAFYNPDAAPLNGCTLGISGAAADKVTMRVVEHCPVNYTIPDDGYVVSDAPGLYPDILRPLNAADLCLRPRRFTSVWVTAEKLPAGRSEFLFTLKDASGNGLCAASAVVEVLPVCAVKNRLIYTNWMHYDCISDAEFMSAEYAAALKKYVDNAVGHGVNVIYTPLFTPPLDTAVGTERRTVQLVGVTQKGSGYEFDFSPLGRFLDSAFARGIEYAEFSHLFTQWGASACPKIIARTANGHKRVFGWETPSDDPSYLAFLDAFLPELVSYIKARGIADKCFFHLSDEPNKEHLDRYIKLSAFVKARAGGVKFIEALSLYEYFEKGLVDIPVVATDHADAFIKNGAPFWAYYCCGQHEGGLSNRFIAMPPQRTRIIGFQLYLNGCAGFLHWGYNFYNTFLSLAKIDPYHTSDAGGAFPAGDAFIVYPGADGPLDSVRNEIMYDAVQDYNAACLLGDLTSPEYARGWLCDRGVKSGFTDYPKSAARHIEIRRELNRKLQELSSGATKIEEHKEGA
ncbi:MAG: DUF4091 domain-containing protein [Clostridiales bacterium]|jgi:hypothetical protein|nr:DUF4091 domain-containing protein [Clostridiales bacterium]